MPVAFLALSSSRRRSLGAWAALLVLGLDILVGTMLPMARAARAAAPISAADWVICSASGGAAPIGDETDAAAAKARAAILCALCLPLAQACLPAAIVHSGPGAGLAMVLRPPAVGRVVAVTVALAFDARAPPPLQA